MSKPDEHGLTEDQYLFRVDAKYESAMNPQQSISPMLEKCARILASSQLAIRIGREPGDKIFDEALNSWWTSFIPDARDCLQALTDVDDKTLDAICAVGPDTNSGQFNYDDARNVLTAAIRSILGESK